VRRGRGLTVLCSALGAALALRCDPVPDLYVVSASVDAGGADTNTGFDAGDASPDAAESGAPDAGPDECMGLSCPACPPNPGECCPSGIPCVGDNCSADCDAGCAGCGPGEMCCSKQGGQPLCRNIEGGKCP
jgi:hypothetical protein